MTSQTTEDKLQELIDIFKTASLARPIEFLHIDAKTLLDAQMLLEVRADEISELGKLCNKLDGDLGAAQAANEILRTEQVEWQQTIRSLQDSADKYRRNSLSIDRVREVLNMLQFALEAAKRAYGMPMDASEMLTAIWEETHNQLLYQPDDDIPF